jgi:hypothetical protein
MSFISFRNHYFIIQINSNELKGKLKRKMNEHNRNLRLPLQLAARKNTKSLLVDLDPPCSRLKRLAAPRVLPPSGRSRKRKVEKGKITRNT